MKFQTLQVHQMWHLNVFESFSLRCCLTVRFVMGSTVRQKMTKTIRQKHGNIRQPAEGRLGVLRDTALILKWDCMRYL